MEALQKQDKSHQEEFIKSIILYGSETALSEDHQRVKTAIGHYYIRAEVVDGDDLEALTKVQCLEGETLINTVQIQRNHERRIEP